MTISITDFIVREKMLAVTVFCSIVTFQFISTFKINIVDPIFEFLLSDYMFDFLKITIREGQDTNQKLEQKKLVVDFGQLLKEFMKWISIITIIFIISINSNLINYRRTNTGAAIL